MPTLFFTSDTHFGHNNVIKYSNRPFANAEEMDETMIANWNSVVRDNDVVWHLGDFGFRKPEQLEIIIKRLRGRINFIKGNHDKQTWKIRHLFESAQDYAEIKPTNEQRIILLHYPMAVWNKGHYGSWHLCGHSHGTMNCWHQQTTSLDVGVDNFNYTPVSYEQVAEIMSKKEYRMFDHHKSRK